MGSCMRYSSVSKSGTSDSDSLYLAADKISYEPGDNVRRWLAKREKVVCLNKMMHLAHENFRYSHLISICNIQQTSSTHILNAYRWVVSGQDMQ